MKKTNTTGAIFSLALFLLVSGESGELGIHSGAGGESIVLIGPESRSQIVVTGEKGLNLTREVEYQVVPPDIATIDETGFVTPLKNGRGTLVATTRGDAPRSAEARIEVSEIENPRDISFPNDVVPIFTRNHCNAGACHAKATGQNGFQLSLLGYGPEEDYEQIVVHSRGRRVLPSAPAHSLLLMKATGELPHEGGARLDRESSDYRTLERWIRTGMVYRPENDPDIERIEIFPRSAVTESGARLQVAVTAFFSDGSQRTGPRSTKPG
jgi:hypothetical protein